MKARLTHLGAATLLLELGDGEPLRLLTDPALDPPGRRYAFKFGLGTRKTKGPALPPGGLPPIDAVLLSHDEHADNLDDAGRALLSRARRVLTTASAAARLRPALGDKVLGLKPWESSRVAAGANAVTVHAVPARHGQRPLPLWLIGDTTGFVLEWPGPARGAVYLSGDTVSIKELEEVGRRFKIGVAFLNLGGVRFWPSGPLRYTFDGRDAARAASALNPARIVPLHYDGWTHFRETLRESEQALSDAGWGDRLLRLEPGWGVDLDL